MKTKLFTRRQPSGNARRARDAEEDPRDLESVSPRTRRGPRRARRVDSEMRTTGKGPNLRSLSSPVIAKILAFRASAPAERPSYQPFRSEMSEILDEFQGRARRRDLDADGHAHFALVALADETAMAVEWEGERRWEENPLQVELFGKFDAGDRFFTRLRDALEDDEPDVLEVFFNVLCVGFQGSHRDDPATLTALRGRIMQRLDVLDLRDEPHITPDAYGRQLERPLLTRRFPVFWAIPFVLTAIGLYAAYYITLDRQVETIKTSTTLAVPTDE